MGVYQEGKLFAVGVAWFRHIVLIVDVMVFVHQQPSNLVQRPGDFMMYQYNIV